MQRNIMSSKKETRLGMSCFSHDDVKATVIKYHSCEDFEIEFENGTRRKMSNWYHFEHSDFSYQRKYNPCRTKNRLGTSRQMNNGLYATIIEYTTSHDMKILFEDGIAKEGVSWRDFCSGNVAHPNIKGTQLSINELVLAFYLEPLGFRKVAQRSIESRELGLGGKEIDLYNDILKIAVEYDGEYSHKNIQKDINKNRLLASLDIQVYRFREKKCPAIDGNVYTVEDSKYLSKSLNECIQEFIYHVLGRKDYEVNFVKDKDAIDDYIRQRKRAPLHLFEERRMCNGLMCTIVSMISCRDITVKFEDGAIVSHKHYSSFRNGSIAHPKDTFESKKQQRLNSVKRMNNGHWAEVIDYQRWNKVTVRFDNDEIATTTWYAFSHSSVGLPSGYVKNHIGDSVMQKRGVKATIIEVVDANHIDVEFEDGTIVRNRKYNDFLKGVIANPKLPPCRKERREDRLGERRTMKNGKQAEIVCYRSANDIDLQWEDGTISSHKKYSNFCTGAVR